jgi:calcium/calmodulin-dependent protein kinase I
MMIIDFGLAAQMEKSYILETLKCGTLLYSSPEQATGSQYGKPTDIWATGLVLYEALFCKHPIWEKKIDTRDLYKSRLSTLTMKELTKNKDLDPLGMNLFLKLCQIKPSKRYTAEQALKHPWITREKNGEIPMGIQEEME